MSLVPSSASYGLECMTYIMAMTGNNSVETVKEDWCFMPCKTSTMSDMAIVP